MPNRLLNNNNNNNNNNLTIFRQKGHYKIKHCLLYDISTDGTVKCK